MSTNSSRKPNDPDRDNLRFAVIVWIILALLTAGFGFLVSCAPVREVIRTEYRDTTIIRTEYRDTVIAVPIPLEKDHAITQVGDTSHLETSVARSEAFVDSTGRLHHSLENKHENTLPATVPVKAEFVFHGITQNETASLIKTQYRDKPLRWWQRFRLGAFWYLLGAVVLLLLWTFRKVIFRFVSFI